MSAFGKFLRHVDGGYMFHCPGCQTHHFVWVDELGPNGAQWIFNGDLDRPTFNPSILVTTPDGCIGNNPRRCHSFIRDGLIEYCGDSQHELAGKTVPLPEWEEEK